MKKTKILASIGPSSNEVDTFREMVINGVNVARINFSHATLEEREKAVDTVIKVRNELNLNIGILYDTKGPEFRNDEVENGELLLEEGKEIKIFKEHILGNKEGFSVNYPEALDDLEAGNIILLENGLMKIKVISKTKDYVNCKIINGGVLGMTTNVFMSFISLSLGAFLALPGSLYFYLKKKDKIVPFGPFIIAGFLIMLFMQVSFSEIIDFVTFI